jgi:hypothetical protein
VIAQTKVMDGFKVELFASEREFPDLRKPGADVLRQPRPALGRRHADLPALEAG